MFLESFLFSVNVTLPTILMLLLGIVLRRRKLIDDHFSEMASKLVFNIALPALLFLNIVKNPAEYSSQIGLISAGVICTLIIYLAAEFFAYRYIQRSYRGIFVQGVFRGNSGILGLALAINAYGSSAIAPASVYVASMTLLFNILAVITLTHSLGDGKLSGKKIAKSLAKNPLILSILAGILFSKAEIPIPISLIRTGDYLASIALPLALICTGATLNFKQLKQFKAQNNPDSEASRTVIFGAVGRLIVAPLVFVLIGKFVFQLEPMFLGISFLVCATPLAAAAYAMIRYFGGDAVATANLIGITALGSMLTSSIGLLILRQIGWV